MKNPTKKIAATTIIALSLLTSCNTPAEKVENAEETVIQANKELDAANEAYLKDVENYRIETATQIEANNKSISEFNSRIETEKKEVKADYKKKIAELEQKNSDMKKKMDDYKLEGKDKWEMFKAEFSRDMSELGKAFSDLTVKNNK